MWTCGQGKCLKRYRFLFDCLKNFCDYNLQSLITLIISSSPPPRPPPSGDQDPTKPQPSTLVFSSKKIKSDDGKKSRSNDQRYHGVGQGLLTANRGTSVSHQKHWRRQERKAMPRGLIRRRFGGPHGAVRALLGGSREEEFDEAM